MKKDHPEQLPLARTEQLIIKEVDDEVLVYDLKTDQAHCLNKTAALVWQNCDGEKSVEEITRLLETDSRTKVEENVVWLALDQLEKFNLIQKAVAKPASLAGINRRQVIRTLGVAAIAIPMIVSIASPTAEAQSSCKPKNFAPCNLSTNCCSGLGNCTNGSTPDCK